MVFKSYKRMLESEKVALNKLDSAIFDVNEAKHFTRTDYRQRSLEAIIVLLQGIIEDIKENEFQTERV